MGVFEEFEGCQFRNYEALIWGNIRINMLSHQEESCQASFEAARNSKKKSKYSYEIYIRHFKLKNFINKVLPLQARSFFRFALGELQQHNSANWTV